MKKVLKRLFEATYFKKRKEKIIFVLSTGRCGSTSITKMFNQYPSFLAFHEEIPELIKLSTELAELPEEKERIYKELRNLFKNKKWEAKNGQIPIHSDHRLWNFVGFLNEFFPNAYFIHLIRNPVDSINSYVPRNWYTEIDKKKADENMHAKFRLHANRVGDLTDEQWMQMNQIDKCVWYWNFINSKISRQLNNIDKKKQTVIRLEEIMHQMNKKIKADFELQNNFFFKNEITNQTRVTVKQDESFFKNLQISLNKYGVKTIEDFYSSYLCRKSQSK